MGRGSSRTAASSTRTGSARNWIMRGGATSPSQDRSTSAPKRRVGSSMRWCDMNKDEQAIRALVNDWMRATLAGDLDRVLELMAEDVVFLGGGRPPMRGREAFAAASRAMEGKVRVDGRAEIQEVQ